MLLLLALVLLSDCQGQGYYGVVHGLIIIGCSSVFPAASGHTTPTELIHEKRYHQSHYQDQDDTSGTPKVEGDNGLAICL